MYAIVRIGGRQYTVEPGRAIIVEKLPSEVGDKLEFDDVLFVNSDGKTTVGQPIVEGAKVHAEVIRQFRGKKIIVFRYHSSKRYRRKTGHRQYYTRLMINDITVS